MYQDIITWTWLTQLCFLATFGCGFNPAVDGPPAGNPDGHCAVPAEAQAEDTSKPDLVVGNGTKESCTSGAVRNAVAQGGIITFDCGPDPITIGASVVEILNTQKPKTIIDGGGKVALRGSGAHIIILDTCNHKQIITSPDCSQQDTPQLTVQNLTFFEGAPAITVSGGRLKVVNCRFFSNLRNDGSGGAVYGQYTDYGQYNHPPIYIVNSTFGGQANLGNANKNGGGLSGYNVSFTILNSLFSDNSAIGGDGAVGGGGAISSLGDSINLSLSLCGVRMTDNRANGPGGAIYFVTVGSNASGTLTITDSLLRNNPDSFTATAYPGIYVMGGKVIVQSSTIE